MTAILLRITAMLVCFFVAMLGLIFVIHGIQLGYESSIILVCAVCTIGGIVGVLYLTRRS
jgi:Cu/Ag efflux pump CusA